MNSLALDSILKKLPYLKDLVDTCGDMSLFNYANNNYHGLTDGHPLFVERKKEFLSIVEKYVSGKFGQEIAKKVTHSLQKNYCVSTAEHYGPMGHPFFFQSAILRGLVNPDAAIVNLCTSHVSLGNSSYPRGIVFHGDGANAPAECLHLPFFGVNKRMSPVFGLSAYSEKDIKHHTFPRLDSYFHDKKISEEKYSQIKLFLNNFVLSEDILGEKSYSSQITRLNHSWWKALFPELPDFIPLDAENLVSTILADHLGRDTPLSEMLTRLDLQERIEAYFDGISCCFDQKNKRGTYLFWYLDKENNRHALWREGNELITGNGTFRVKLDSSAIISSLSSGDLIPSGLLIYTTLSCYYGLTCFGGFSQGDYLPRIQEAYGKLLGHMGREELRGEQSAILNEDMIFLHESQGQISTALDIHIHGTRNIEEMRQITQNTTLYQSIGEMEDEILRCL